MRQGRRAKGKKEITSPQINPLPIRITCTTNLGMVTRKLYTLACEPWDYMDGVDNVAAHIRGHIQLVTQRALEALDALDSAGVCMVDIRLLHEALGGCSGEAGGLEPDAGALQGPWRVLWSARGSVALGVWSAHREAVRWVSDGLRAGVGGPVWEAVGR